MEHRSYGVNAAAQTYYGKSLDSLTLAEAAMIAGLPKAPSAYNPITNGARAMQRRNYVLHRMLELNYITKADYDVALNQASSTYDYRDAWFNGYTPAISATAWVGYDNFESLGNRETGGKTALPMWIEFMKTALHNLPEAPLAVPGVSWRLLSTQIPVDRSCRQ